MLFIIQLIFDLISLVFCEVCPRVDHILAPSHSEISILSALKVIALGPPGVPLISVLHIFPVGIVQRLVQEKDWQHVLRGNLVRRTLIQSHTHYGLLMRVSCPHGPSRQLYQYKRREKQRCQE